MYNHRNGAVGPVTDRRTFLRRMASVAVATGGAVLLAGCGDGDGDGDTTAGSSEGGGGLTATTFLSPIPPESLAFLPELLAITDGHFADNGLEVTMQRMRGSAQAVQGILSELALVARATDIELMLAVGARGAAELVNVGTLQKNSTIRMVSSPDNPVASAAEFAGRTIGIPSEGGSSELTVDLVARAAGITDYAKQVVGLTAGTYDLVESGRIDCYMVSVDTSIILEQTRGAVIYAPSDDIFAGGQCYMSNLTSLGDEEGPGAEIVTGFMSALRASAQAILDDRDNDFENVLASIRTAYSFDTLMDDEVAVESTRQQVEAWILDGEENVLLTTEERWDGVYAELVDAGSIEDGLDPSAWFTNEYVA